MASWERGCECCGPYRTYPDITEWHPKGEEFNPDDTRDTIDLETHKETFKFGEHYEIIQYP
jgi:hypothetical protein